MLIVIPAYNPDKHLLEVLKSLKKELNNQIIVVDDGSDKSKENIFENAKEYALVLKHDANKGKGRAMKTALEYIRDNMPDEDGVVFVDADGQHKASDVKKMIEAFDVNKDSLIIGCRVFDKDVPIRSRIGNKITRFVFKVFTHKYVSDTQTGLRALSTKYIPFLLRVEGDRYEYEMNMLIDAVDKKINMVEVPIETIYIDKQNSTSHFNVFRDSYLVYKKFLRFVASSLSCTVIDYFAFLLFISIFGSSAVMILLSNILARVISGTINYNINKRVIFKHKHRNKTALKFFMLAVFIILTNSAILLLFTKLFGIVPYIAKILVGLLLFVINYSFQSKSIFRNDFNI